MKIFRYISIVEWMRCFFEAMQSTELIDGVIHERIDDDTLVGTIVSMRAPLFLVLDYFSL